MTRRTGFTESASPAAEASAATDVGTGASETSCSGNAMARKSGLQRGVAHRGEGSALAAAVVT
ncbi:MAG: hypothetical protein IAI50_11675 [Candidatus Eremiobacteraeota bacterium]|nr:hypothetical protein [Candidatus Eremiobacteraeota bacterium]